MNHTNFNTAEPLAYFMTWTTYGTWLPGDERGWSRKKEGQQEASPLVEEINASRMKEPAFVLDTEQRAIVEATIGAHCEIRNWTLHAVSARSNHVHVVVTARGYSPDTVMRQFKAWCTRKLRDAGVPRKNVWTESGSRRWINRESDLHTAIDYVVNAQDRKGAECE